jgi:P4 family phage/plasmid primase-like protien
MSAKSGFVPVSKDRPCPICGKPDWCSVSEGGNFACCRRENKGGTEKADKNGDTYYLHRLGTANGNGKANNRSHHANGTQGPSQDKPAVEPAPAEITHQVYSKLLDRLGLIGTHRRDLNKRGFQCDPTELGYRTLGSNRSQLIQYLVKTGQDKFFATVPGFYRRDDGSWGLAGKNGLLIPVRDFERRIVAIKIRCDGGNAKYIYLSSKRHGGAGPGSPVHFPLFEGDTKTVRVTEGVLKADLATHFSGILTVGLPGVGDWRRAGNALKALGAETVLVAYDADAKDNRMVAHALSALVKDLHKSGFKVKLELWDKADGKGIDDLLATGKKPKVLEGDEAIAAATSLVAREALDDPHRLARLFLEHKASHADRPRLIHYREQFWFWTGTHWVRWPDTEVRAAVTACCKQIFDAEFTEGESEDGKKKKVPKVTTGLVGNVIQALMGDVIVSRDTPQPSWLDSGRQGMELLAMANGLLDVGAHLAGQEDCLRPHSPLWFSPVFMSYNFDPTATCSEWQKFLDRNLGGRHGPKALLLQQWFGYLLLPDTSQQRFLMMVGEGANGKSVVCAVLRGMLDDDNVSAVPFELFGDKFRLEGTLGKLANIVAEVGELDRDRVAEGVLKAFISGDAMAFEQKFKPAFTARPTARLVLATNNPPRFSDKSDGVWRRMSYLPFDVQIPENERVLGMDSVEWWRDRNELSGILNWALAGLQKLRLRGRFDEPPDSREAVANLRLDSKGL